MDAVIHALVGAVTAYSLGADPTVGAAIAVAPDLPLGIKRKVTPARAYDVTHSGAFAIATSLAALAVLGSLYAHVILACLTSHIVLDLPTHGKIWAPPLLYPLSKKRFSFGEEWEWFNRSWWQGLYLSTAWCMIWIVFVAK